MLDDGWFDSRCDDTSGLGDCQVSTEVWPDGLGPLIDHVTGLGMQFELWFEPEMVNPDPDVARAHPEWIMSADPERLPVPSRNQQVLNLAIPACYDYVRDAMVALPHRIWRLAHHRAWSLAGVPRIDRPVRPPGHRRGFAQRASRRTRPAGRMGFIP